MKGNAVAPALNSAAVIFIVEPRKTSVGGNLLAIVRDGADPYGLDATGGALRNADPLEPVERDPAALGHCPGRRPQLGEPGGRVGIGPDAVLVGGDSFPCAEGGDCFGSG